MPDELINRSNVLRMMKNSKIDGPHMNMTSYRIWQTAHDCCIDCVKAAKTEGVISLEEHEKIKRMIVSQHLREQRLMNQPGVFIPNFELPTCCNECVFRANPEEIRVDWNLYKKISKCMLAPEDIEDPWRDVMWQVNHREEFCPLVEIKGVSNNDT